MRTALTSLLTLTLLATLTAGCSQQKARGFGHANESTRSREAVSKSSGYAYHYYPSAEVYYDPAREVYFWHAAAYWGVGKRLPSTYKLEKSERVTVNLDTKMPYRKHHLVVARHPNPNPDAAYASVPTNK